MSKNPLISLTEIELRDLCRHRIDSFEQWCRRVIDEKLKSDYGNDYINAEVQPGQPLVKSQIKKTIEQRMNDNPNRFPRYIDAIVMEDIEYFFCRDDLYTNYFKDILTYVFSGQDEIRSVLQRLTNIRNKLSHGNMISIKDSERCLCYTDDFVDCFINYYDKQGKSKDYNVPIFMRMKDSQGNDFIREHLDWYPWNIHATGHHGDPKVRVRSGDTYKIWVEVDSSFPENTYDVTWEFKCGKRELKGSGNVVEVSFSDKDVSYWFEIKFKLKTHNTWHRRATCDNDDEMTFSSFSDVLPPINSTY